MSSLTCRLGLRPMIHATRSFVMAVAAARAAIVLAAEPMILQKDRD